MIPELLRLIPPFKGKHRIARLLLGSTLKTSRDWKVEGKLGCTYLVPNFVENVGFEILINGFFEKSTVDFVDKRLKHDSVFLDIGANIGAITVPISKQNPHLKVISVEASPRIFNYLKKNIDLNDLQNVVTINKAMDAFANQSVEFFSPDEKFGKGSLSPVFTQIGETVLTTTIDEIFMNVNDAVSFIKIDIEGFEYKAFLGGARELKKSNAPEILFEFEDWAEPLAGALVGTSQQILIDYGYKIYKLAGGSLTEIPTPLIKGSHMLFATKDSV